MGVTGLWRLIEPAGKPVPVETLENKVLAVDISIWLHQMVKGYQDAKGAPLPNAHLIGLFQRLCKLLYFRIKPVFVFDGGFPDLKKETIAKRQDNKSKYNSESERLKRELALLLSKKTAVKSLLGKQTSPKKGGIVSESSNNDDIFKLPALPEREEESESESDDEQDSSGSIDLHTVDMESKDFKTLPVKEKYDLLLELKETRKMNSWGRLHELPKKSDHFSDFQMQRLLKRRKVQECLEETEKEMGDTGMSLNELESLLNEEGIETKVDTLPTRRIASNNNTRFLLINNVKQALKDARMKKLKEIEQKPEIQEAEPSKDEVEDDLEKAIKMSLECAEEKSTEHQDYGRGPGTSKTEATKLPKDELEEDLQKAINLSLKGSNENEKYDCVKTDDSWTTCMTDTDYSTDSDENDGFMPPDMSSAKAYIMQYSDYTPKAIEQIVEQKNLKIRQKTKNFEAEQIIQELYSEKSIINDKNVSAKKNTFQKEHIFKSNENKKELQLQTQCSNSTQESVIYIENSPEDIIQLYESSNENIEKKEDSPLMTSATQSESTDDDFEEVTDEYMSKKPIVELTLNMGNVPDENDIFADVFKFNKEHTIHGHIQSHEASLNLDQTKTINETESYLKNEVRSSVYPKPLSASDSIICSTNEVKETPADREKDKSQQIKVSNVSFLNDRKTTAAEYEELADTEIPKETLNKDQLNSIVDEIQNAEKDILQEKGRLDRIGRNITEQMTKDAQELLQIFGIPYVVAPMEAEAQCAFLENIKLTDGTITDDSDIWLFGGRTVYKNFFNQKKHVLQFLAERIENSFNLTREQLILLALLVGSDYTTGVTGIGPVTALEILSSFPFNRRQLLTESLSHLRYALIIAGLKEFKQWVRSGKRTDNVTLKKKLKNVELADEFPSIRVVQAYMEPNVEKSNEKFTWGELDITVLRDYTKAKFGWSQNKLDEIIKPVLKRIMERKCQKSVKDYFQRKIEFQSLEDHMSKRVKAAVQRMGPEPAVESQRTEENKTDSKKSLKRNLRKSQNDSNSDEVKSKSITVSNKSKRKKNEEESVLPNQVVRVVSENNDGRSGFEINIQKTDRFKEIIPQREKNKQSLLENKMKAIELFRKTKIDQKKKPTKRKALVPKDKADLSESSDSN